MPVAGVEQEPALVQQARTASTNSRDVKLFSDPPGGILPASAVVASNKPITGEVATMTVPGQGEQPAVKTVAINTRLLVNGPRRLSLDMPGNINVVITRRADVQSGVATPMTATASNASESANSTAPVTVWVGDVLGYRGAASSAILVTAENGGVYGKITYVTRKGAQKTFTISPLVTGGADPVAAAGGNMTVVEAASRYPNIDPTKHVVMEVIEPNYGKLHAEQAQRQGSLVMDSLAAVQAELNAKKKTTAFGAGVATVLTTELAANASDISGNQTMQPPTDAQSLAEAMAASAGFGASKDPADYLAAATSLLPSYTNPSATAVAPADPSTSAAVTPDTGRKLLQANTVQDILMVYTPRAASQSGGVATVENNIRIAIAATNKAYVDSDVRIQLNIVGIRQVSYTEPDNKGLTVLSAAAGGSIPNLHQWRNELGADLVQIWSMNECGVAYVNPGADWLFSQVGHQCWGGQTAAHELGHNQGCGHNVEEGGAPKGYAYGFRRCDLGSKWFMTIMSYPCSSTQWPPTIMYFSNPNKFWNGVPAGNANTGHCARMLGETAASVAAARNTVTPASGTIRLINLAPNKCLDAPSYAAGTRVHLWDCHGGANQNWQLQADGSLKIPGTNVCLDVRSSGTANGTPIQVWDCNGTPAQLWFYDAQRRLHPYAAPHMCLDQAAGNTANGAQMHLWDCQTGNNNQVWDTTTTGLRSTFNPQNQAIRSALNNLVLDVYAYNYANTASVVMWAQNGQNNQRWQMDNRGALRSTHNTNKCLDASNANTGSPVYIFDCHTGGNQRWFQDTRGRLRPYHAVTKCLDIKGANTAQGAVVQLWDCVDVNQQKWSVA